MQLSPHFTATEMSVSDTAVRLGIDNTPSPAVLENLKALCEAILEPIRVHFGKPIKVTSAYRAPEVNKVVGGNLKGQHPAGQAVDFEITGVSNIALAQTVIDLKLKFDQLILEFHVVGDPNSGWVHCSHKKEGSNRGEVLTASKKDGKTVYSKGLPA